MSTGDWDATGRGAVFAAAGTLCQRELVRFFRQRNRVIGALVQPLVFWLLFSSGLRSSFRPSSSLPDLSYAEYFFPGILVMIVLFTAIFATISIIEDRRAGFMQEVLVAPAPRVAVVAGKTLGGAVLAIIQAALFMVLAPWAGVPLGVLNCLCVFLFLFVVGVALTGLGVCIAWRMDSTQGFHAIMSVFLMPMWLLSGAFFPAEGAPAWLWWTITLNPLTYGVAGVRRLFYLQGGDLPPGLPSLPICIVVTLGFAAATCTLATWLAERRPSKGL